MARRHGVSHKPLAGASQPRIRRGTRRRGAPRPCWGWSGVLFGRALLRAASPLAWLRANENRRSQLENRRTEVAGATAGFWFLVSGRSLVFTGQPFGGGAGYQGLLRPPICKLRARALAPCAVCRQLRRTCMTALHQPAPPFPAHPYVLRSSFNACGLPFAVLSPPRISQPFVAFCANLSGHWEPATVFGGSGEA